MVPYTCSLQSSAFGHVSIISLLFYFSTQRGTQCHVMVKNVYTYVAEVDLCQSQTCSLGIHMSGCRYIHISLDNYNMQ